MAVEHGLIGGHIFFGDSTRRKARADRNRRGVHRA